MRACSLNARRVVPALVGIGVLALGACTSASADMSPVTVTVYPTGPATSSPIPTEHAGAPNAGGSGPRLSAGPLRGAPADYSQAFSRMERAKTSESVQGFFVSPSGNIFCNVVQDGAVVACELAEGRIKDPTVCPPDGPTSVRRLELSADRVTPACSGSIRQPGADAPKLPYGVKTIVAGTPIECVSERAGVTCIDTSGRRGFFVAKGTFAIF